MRTWTGLAAMGLAGVMGAGCGRMDDGGASSDPVKTGTCAAGCARGFVCRQLSCVLDGGALWDVQVSGGQVRERDPSGSAWDFPGGLPDPYACLVLTGERRCTETAQDTLRPSWNESLGTATATGLMSGLRGSLWDEDVASNDPICGEGVIGISENDLLKGRVTLSCSLGSFEVRFQPR